MDIRTKLVFALVATALGSMLVLGGFAWWIAQDLLQQAALRHLESVVESKHRDLERVYAGWHESVNLIRSRTQLRLSLSDWNRDRSVGERVRIERIIDDARRASRKVKQIVIFAADGTPVASTGSPLAEAVVDASRGAEGNALHFHGIAEHEGAPAIALSGPMTLRERAIGSIAVVLDAGDLFDVTGDYTGLGATGETVIATREPDAGALIVSPVRHASAPLRRRLPGEQRETAIVRAVNGESRVLLDGAVDYRDVRVWAATRHLDAPDWGVVVKIDEAEARAPVVELRDTLVRLGLSLAAFAVLLGTALGIYFARPIQALAELADRVRRGERELRADVSSSEDEVGLLATALNEMLDEIHRVSHEPSATHPGRAARDA